MLSLHWGIDHIEPPPADHASVWLVSPDDDHADAIAPHLSAPERERRDGFLHMGARAQFLTGRWLLRNVIARLDATSPADVHLHETERGALELYPPRLRSLLGWRLTTRSSRPPAASFVGPGGKLTNQRWQINLSHTDGLVALAVARTPVGVDVENLERRGRTVELSDRFFAPSEAAALRALAPTLQRDRFFALWTLKEAYIKARGQGLAIPLASFAFDLDRDPLAFSPQPGDTTNWQFMQLDPTPRHRLALALSVDA